MNTDITRAIINKPREVEKRNTSVVVGDKDGLDNSLKRLIPQDARRCTPKENKTPTYELNSSKSVNIFCTCGIM